MIVCNDEIYLLIAKKIKKTFCEKQALLMWGK